MFLSNVRSENGVLYIEYAQPDNQGVYICQSTLSNVSPVQVLVTVVPVEPVTETYNISASVDRLKIPTGGSGTVDCNVSGRPAPIIKWTKVTFSFNSNVLKHLINCHIFCISHNNLLLHSTMAPSDSVPTNAATR